jgi:DNA sulfur modification protein DndD
MWINNSENSKNTIKERVRELNKLNYKKLKLNEAIVKAPEKDVLSPIIKEINELNKKKGIFENEIKNLLDQTNSIEFETKNIKRAVEKKLEYFEELNLGSRKVELLKKSKIALNSYSVKLKDVKAKEFSEKVSELFKFLIRKDDLFDKIKVDPNSFSVNFYKKEKNIPKKRLSAGEKQMFSIAVLWALSKLSGRELPFIIDTPLARLDNSHRDNLVEKFFPNAGSQIIILSTNSEVNKEYLEKVDKYVSKKFVFDYENEKSEIKKGYFW